MAFSESSGDDENNTVGTLEQLQPEYKLRVLDLLNNRISYSELMKIPLRKLEQLIEAQSKLNKNKEGI